MSASSACVPQSLAPEPLVHQQLSLWLLVLKVTEDSPPGVAQVLSEAKVHFWWGSFFHSRSLDSMLKRGFQTPQVRHQASPQSAALLQLSGQPFGTPCSLFARTYAANFNHLGCYPAGRKRWSRGCGRGRAEEVKWREVASTRTRNYLLEAKNTQLTQKLCH